MEQDRVSAILYDLGENRIPSISPTAEEILDIFQSNVEFDIDLFDKYLRSTGWYLMQVDPFISITRLH